MMTPLNPQNPASPPVAAYSSATAPAPPPSEPIGSRAVGVLAQLVGLAVFVAGLVALWYVFQTANALLTEPTSVIAAAAPPPAPVAASGTASAAAAQPNAALQIGQDFTGFLRRLLTLLLLCIVGGVVSSVGANLFFKARRGVA